MNIDIIEDNLKKIILKLDKNNFIYDFLLAFGLPKSSINRLKKGDYNQSKYSNEIIWSKKIYFRNVLENEDVHDIIDEILKSSKIEKYKIRFVIVTDYKTFLSRDVKTGDTLDIELSKLDENLNFFLPLIGREKIILDKENPADIRAANQMGKLYDQIIRDDTDYDLDKYRDHLNLFFTRLLFLYYADDSEIFNKNQFLNSITKFTEKDGSDLKTFFNNLFSVLNIEDRLNTKSYLKDFPYVNGNLFHGKIILPEFSKITRQMIIDGASLDWHLINPDILGSMLQAVVSPDERDEDEMHYTSVPNILKVIKPLFLDDIERKIELAGNDEFKIKKILKYIYNIKVFDPACGSGNFLIIAYKQLCLLEIKIFEKLLEINPNDWRMSVSGISLNQFYGIEKSHYATETTKLSLWLAEHQMNLLFKNIFGVIKPSLPLSETGVIICENSISIDWQDFCKFEKKTSFIYIFGNPPFKGSRKQNLLQKKDVYNSIRHIHGFKRLDYVSLWYFKASKFVENTKHSLSCFVSTNSICQGEHVSLLWPEILKNVEIIFAVKTFKWKNNAKDNAGVSCVIVALGKKDNKKKILIDGPSILETNYISPYLTTNNNINVSNRENHFLKIIPEMIYGNMPLEGGFLKLNQREYVEILNQNEKIQKFIRPLIGGSEFINGTKRWCIWIDDKDLNDALKIPEIKLRIEKVKKFRKSGGDVAKSLVNRSHQFRYRHEAKKNFLLIPCTSSSNREYLPVGFFDKRYISMNSAQIINDPPLFIFSILSSKIHMLWVKSVGGKLETNVRYSSGLCFNTFPLNELTNDEIKKLENLSLKIIDEREKFSDQTIAKLYSSDMPNSLKRVHEINDNFVDRIIFKDHIINNNDDKISYLFSKYEKCVNNEKRKLF